MSFERFGSCRHPGSRDSVSCHEHKGASGCQCSTRIERFMEPCLLLLLSESPSHGYDLISKLTEFGFSSDQDPGMVYRTLRRLEEIGMVQSRWAVAAAGPARREYSVTQEGVEHLRAWAETLRRNVESLSSFLERFRKVEFSDPGRPDKG